MDTIKINRTVKFEKYNMEIRYEGVTEKEDINQNKIKKMINFLINNSNHDDLAKDISFIRTILKDCEEQKLFISYKNTSISEFIKYENSDIVFYEKVKKEPNNQYARRYIIKYEPSSGIKIDYNNHETDIVDYSGIKLFTEEMTEAMQQINHLRNAKPIVLDDKSKVIIEIYKLFYNENPDFSNNDIAIKIQTMVSILSEFGIYFGIEYYFNLFEKNDMPLSLELGQEISALYPFGEVNNVENNIKLPEDSQKIIKIVGESIRESISDKESQNETLKTISKVIYARKCELSNSKQISNFINHTSDEVESNLKLVKSIENKIYK